ncbi:hypothetical protein ANN_18223 [Periplaneta americana]|uniref:Uncharacterized protein n=1 Tax=Periplaneta americana TaxID=6978 RepID=A0ABQ8SPL8_PERAM|nr:hypothetical protein ANN_18223 [Periplaneta americana]
MADLCEGGNEPTGSLKATSLVYRSSARVCVRNCVSIRRPEFECSGPQLEGPEFECSGPQLEGPEFEYSELSLKSSGMPSAIFAMEKENTESVPEGDRIDGGGANECLRQYKSSQNIQRRLQTAEASKDAKSLYSRRT